MSGQNEKSLCAFFRFPLVRDFTEDADAAEKEFRMAGQNSPSVFLFFKIVGLALWPSSLVFISKAHG